MPVLVDVAGLLRRVRRRADLSQRELADRLGIGKSTVAAAERGVRDLSATLLAEAAAVAGLRLVLLDEAGREVPPMDGGAARDGAGRRFPAHLDTRHGDVGWWHGVHRRERERPRYTFDRDRELRDRWRAREGTPDDHHLPRPEDDLAHRAAVRAHAARAARQAAWDRWIRELPLRRAERVARGLPPDPPDPHEPEPCTCPPACDDELDRRNRHVVDCPCRCDID